MEANEIERYARELWQLAGAAQKARAYEDKGDTGKAETWRRIEAALRSKHKLHAGAR